MTSCYRACVLLVCSFVFFVSTYAQAPPAPQNLSVHQIHGGTGIGAGLMWQGSTMTASYTVHRAVENSTVFEMIGSVTTTYYADWNVQIGQTYRYFVKAVNSFGTSGPSNIVVFTPSNSTLGVSGWISGTVVDDSNSLPIAGAYVRFHRVVSPNGHAVSVQTNGLGRYIARLDTGRYFVFAGKEGYRGEWFDNSPTMSGATPVPVTVGDTSVTNIGLSPMTPRPKGMIVGNVSDDSTGLPLAGARVSFFFANSIGGTTGIVVETDQNGYYSVLIDTGRFYILTSKQGYRSEWYDNSPTMQGATPVQVVANDTSVANVGLAPFVPPPHVTGTIAGMVIDDTTGLPIPGVRIRFYRPNGFMVSREARTDSGGVYSAVLDTGSYLVFATQFGYRSEWYDNSPTREGGTPVLVSEGVTRTANFGLSRLENVIRLVHVNGTVSDSTTGLPIANALVAIMRTVQGLNHVQHLNGIPGGHTNEILSFPEVGTLHGVVWWGRTGSDGSYSGRVPAGSTYIVVSCALGYVPEFFDNKRSPVDADRLFLTSDTSGIDFALTPNPALQNSIAGSVIDSIGTGVPSRVGLYGITSTGPRAILHTQTDSLGSYLFRYVRRAPYFVKAFPITGYAPAWYKAGAFGITDWHNADTVVANGDIIGIQIGVIPFSPSGFARIAGIVRRNGNAPLLGATVSASSVITGTVVAWDVTDAGGVFSIDELAPGSYFLTIDREGYVGRNVPTFTVDASNNYQVTNATLEASAVQSPTLVSVPYEVGAGWNMVSIPLSVADYRRDALFPTAASNAFAYQSGYQARSVLENGVGYWLKFNAQQNVTLDGYTRSESFVNVTTGWNLVGSLSSPVVAASVVTNPPNIIQSPFYGYSSGGYSPATSLEPARGYWIKMSQPGQLNLTYTPGGPKVAANDGLSGFFNRLEIMDAGGNRQALYFGRGAENVARRYELPPPPPLGVFDARFTSQRILETYHPTTDGAIDYEIAISSADYPITVTWELVEGNGDHFVIEDGAGARRDSWVLTQRGTRTLSDSRRLLLSVRSGRELPLEFTLSQNYPNPFNPATTIRYGLPKDSWVTITLFNMLGQEVAKLDEGLKSAGYHAVEFGSERLASGVYFYRMKASSGAGGVGFVQVRKLVVLK